MSHDALSWLNIELEGIEQGNEELHNKVSHSPPQEVAPDGAKYTGVPTATENNITVLKTPNRHLWLVKNISSAKYTKYASSPTINPVSLDSRQMCDK